MSWLSWVKAKVTGKPASAGERASEPAAADRRDAACTEAPGPGGDGERVDDPELLLAMGWEYSARGNPDRALAVFDRAIAIRPDAAAYYGRGVARCQLKRHADAIADLDRALEMRPRHAAALTERGLARLESGRLDDALADYDAAIAIDPAYGVAHENKGLALLHRKQWAAAVPCFDIALRLTPSRASLRYHRGLAHEMLGDLPNAVRDLRDAVRFGRGAEYVRFAEHRLSKLGARAAAIPDEESVRTASLWPVVEVSVDDTVADVVVRTHAEGKYVARIQLADGAATFVEIYGKYGLRRHLTEIADVIGPRILPLRLRQFDGLWPDGPPEPPGAAPAGPRKPGGGQRLVEGSRLHVLTNAGRLVGVFTEGTPHHDLDLPTVLFGPQPIFARAERTDDHRRCASCQRGVAYFDPVLDDDRLTGYACPHCGASPLDAWVEDRMRPGRWSRDGFLGPTETLREVIARDDATLTRLGVRHDQIADALDRLITRAFEASADRIAQGEARFEAALRASGQRGVAGLAVLPLGATLDDVEGRLLLGQALPADRGTAVGDHDVYLQVYLGYQYCPYTKLRLPWSDDPPPRQIIERESGGVAYRTEPTDRELPCSAQRCYRHANLEFLVVHRATRRGLRGAGLLVHLIRDHHFFEGESSPYRIDPEHAARVLGLL